MKDADRSGPPGRKLPRWTVRRFGWALRLTCATGLVRHSILSTLVLLAACVLLGSCSGQPEQPVHDSSLTPQQLAAALQLPPRSTQPVVGSVDGRTQRRDLITEQLTLRVGEVSIPAVACYSELGYTQRLPAVLWMPGSPNLKEDLIPLDLLSTWADRGFFVLSIDRPFHGQRPGDREDQIRRRGLPAVYGDYVVDLIHAIDYLSHRAEIDPQRLGMVGLSTGGLEALMVGALDPRLKVIVSVSGHLVWPQIFATQAWKAIFTGLPMADSMIAAGMSGEQALAHLSDHMPGLPLIDAARIVPLLAPRPLLLLGGTLDPLVPAASFEATAMAARESYASAGAPESVSMYLEPGRGHALSKRMQARALAWCERWL